MSKYSSLLPTLMLMTACSGAAKTGDAIESNAAYVERPSEDGLILAEVDIDNNGAADVFNYYRERETAPRLLVKKEIDLNRDTRIDVTSFYDDSGVLTREEMDGDFDGRVDWIDHYQNGRRVLSEVDTEFDGSFDLFKYFEKGEIARKERDTNSDGKVDYWEYFEGGQVQKVGRDIDGDGQMDIREE